MTDVAKIQGCISAFQNMVISIFAILNCQLNSVNFNYYFSNNHGENDLKKKQVSLLKWFQLFVSIEHTKQYVFD